MTVGSHEGIQVVLSPSDASEQELVWASSNKAVATVDEAGMVSALSQGTCTVTVASKAYSTVSCHVEVIVGEDGTSDAADNSGDASEEAEVSYVEETNAAAVYPTYYLSEREVAAMDGEQIQFIINQIYAKNGYVFQTGSIQSYFSQMPWYVAVSNDASRLRMSSLDRSNLNLLVRYRDSGAQETSSLGWIWTRHAVDQALTEDYIRNLSRYDVQLLINCIVVAQTIPTATTINAPVYITIGSGTELYPLTKRNCSQVTAAGIRTRTRYSVCVSTTPTGGSFRMIGNPCCSPDNSLLTIDGGAAPAPTA